MKFSMDSVLLRRTPRISSVRERDCGIIKLKDADGNGGQVLSCSDEHRFCLFTVKLKFILCHTDFYEVDLVRCVLYS